MSGVKWSVFVFILEYSLCRIDGDVSDANTKKFTGMVPPLLRFFS